MGILSTILTRIGIPLAIAVIAGIAISTFREQIIGGISSGASTIGQAITTPFGAVLSGIQAGFQNIPETIGFTLPSFQFAFGDSGGQPTPPQAGTVPFMGGQLTTPSGCTIDSQGRISCPTPPIFTPPPSPTPTPSPPPQIMGQPTPSPLTLFQGASFRTAVTLPSGFSGIRTRGEIVEQFPDVIGLFDLLGTTRTEFLPLTAQQVQEQQNNLRLSSQIFEEVKNLREALSFA